MRPVRNRAPLRGARRRAASTIAADPSTPSRKKYFDFDASRLVVRVPPTFGVAFPSYRDPYGQLYAYFSKEGQNQQNWRIDDCAGIAPIAPTPYYRVAGGTKDYFRAFQIISAGKDNAFGTGGPYGPAAPNVSPTGFDDLANFHGSKLGVP